MNMRWALTVPWVDTVSAWFIVSPVNHWSVLFWWWREKNSWACVLTLSGKTLRLAGCAAVALTWMVSSQAQSTRSGMGATSYADALGTGVTFRVWSPNATSVAVPGSFNGWNPTANFLVPEGSSASVFSNR